MECLNGDLVSKRLDEGKLFVKVVVREFWTSKDDDGTISSGEPVVERGSGVSAATDPNDARGLRLRYVSRCIHSRTLSTTV